jgi:hypothetical protein
VPLPRRCWRSTHAEIRSTAAVGVLGTVLIENLSFQGLADPVLAYVGSAPAFPGIDRHSITIRNSRFVTADYAAPTAWLSATTKQQLGHHIRASTSRTTTWKVGTSDSWSGTSTPPRQAHTSTRRSHATSSMCPTHDAHHRTGGRTQRLRTGRSVANEIYDNILAEGYGLNVIGGTDDPFIPGAPGASDARVNWTSTRGRCVGVDPRENQHPLP